MCEHSWKKACTALRWPSSIAKSEATVEDMQFMIDRYEQVPAGYLLKLMEDLAKKKRYHIASSIHSCIRGSPIRSESQTSQHQRRVSQDKS